MNRHLINTDKYSLSLRERSIDTDGHRLLITNFHGTTQEQDFLEPANCNGYGRVRHFRRSAYNDWVENPLPLDPAQKALGLGFNEQVRAQVFQTATCNWRCWYCFVPFELLKGSKKYADWFTVSNLVDLYLDQDNPPPVIDLTGGQPDLVPEWVVWTMQELKERGIDQNIYLWSDDNLSNDYFWKYLSDADIELVSGYEKYGRVCCFKGIDPDSFSFNTRAHPDLFYRQIELAKRLIDLGIDLYAYVTLPSQTTLDSHKKVASFFDRLQEVHEDFPLRVVPLKIQEFSPVNDRMNETYKIAINNQKKVLDFWIAELETRFSEDKRKKKITEVSLK